MPRLIGKTPAPVRLGSPGVWTLQQAADAERDVRWPGVWRNNLLAVVSGSAPYLQIYGKNTVYGDNNPAAQPAALSFVPTDVAWSTSGGYLAVVGGSSMAWYSHNAGVLTLLTNPATMPVGAVVSCAWSPDDKFLAVGHGTTPFVTIYERSGDTLTKLSNPSTLPTGAARQVAWSPSGEFLAVAHNTTPYLTVYQRSDTTFTKLTSTAASGGSAGGDGCAWSPDGATLVQIQRGGTSGWLNIYTLAGATLTKLTGFTLPAVANGRAAFSPTGAYLCVDLGTGNFRVYSASGTTFTVLGSPTPSGGAGAAWGRDGNFLNAGSNLYSISGSTFTLQTALSPAPGGGVAACSFL
ncbi:MAG: WD40 repeat domain-containing protein [Hydrogenophaga sp.]|uniref:WD40 repeat domain-containing protein n=1 Tax=Hydrogenophaga sp. TaxID=1904254 RepID=UPI003D9BFC49